MNISIDFQKWFWTFLNLSAKYFCLIQTKIRKFILKPIKNNKILKFSKIKVIFDVKIHCSGVQICIQPVKTGLRLRFVGGSKTQILKVWRVLSVEREPRPNHIITTYLCGNRKWIFKLDFNKVLIYIMNLIGAFPLIKWFMSLVLFCHLIVNQFLYTIRKINSLTAHLINRNAPYK